MEKSITSDQINQYRLDLANTPGSAALAKATANVGPYAASHGQFEDTTHPAAFSDEIDTGAVTNQKRSGRCWLFSQLNTMRHFTSEKFGIKDLEFSQNYLSFYYRLEKANLFLEHVIATARDLTPTAVITKTPLVWSKNTDWFPSQSCPKRIILRTPQKSLPH